MILLPAYTGKKVGVFGLGKSGSATIASLLASGATVYASDDNANAREALERQERLHPMPHAAWPWSELNTLVLAPGVPLTHPAPHAAVKLAHENKVPVIGDIELLLSANPEAHVIGITGTNGKSTTTALIGHILKQAGRDVEIGGNLGTPVLSLRALDKNGIYVLELSSYQLDLLKTVRIHTACLLNFSPDHIDRHGSMEGYIAAKKHIFDRQQKSDRAIIGIDDAASEALARTLIAETVPPPLRGRAGCAAPGEGYRTIIPVSTAQPASKGINVDAKGMLTDQTSHEILSINVGDFPRLRGRHNWQNAAFAYAACRSVGLDAEEIIAGMQNFPGLAHRMEWIARINGVEFINDSKATNADAAAKALDAYETIYWIAGGKSKEGGIASLGRYFPRIVHTFLIGAAAEEFAGTLKGHGEYTQAGDLKNATELAAKMAFKDKRTNAVVLLSPACASFDQWPNFEVRGDAFRAAVKAIAEKESENAAA